MSIVAALRVPAESFVLARAMRDHPDTTVELEQLVPIDDGAAFLWTDGGDLAAFRAAVADDPAVVAVAEVDRRSDHRLLRVRWRELDDTIVAGVRAESGSVLRAVGRHDEWSLVVRFHDDEGAAEFQSYCETSGTDLLARRVFEPRRPNVERYGLTTAQCDALVAALRMGYFAVPRRCELRDVAGALGVSATAVSERIRRGEANLVEAALTLDGPRREPDPR